MISNRHILDDSSHDQYGMCSMDSNKDPYDMDYLDSSNDLDSHSEEHTLDLSEDSDSDTCRSCKDNHVEHPEITALELNDTTLINIHD